MIASSAKIAQARIELMWRDMAKSKSTLRSIGFLLEENKIRIEMVIQHCL
jgi:hypothetical protein